MKRRNNRWSVRYPSGVPRRRSASEDHSGRARFFAILAKTRQGRKWIKGDLKNDQTSPEGESDIWLIKVASGKSVKLCRRLATSSIIAREARKKTCNRLWTFCSNTCPVIEWRVRLLLFCTKQKAATSFDLLSSLSHEIAEFCVASRAVSKGASRCERVDSCDHSRRHSIQIVYWGEVRARCHRSHQEREVLCDHAVLF